MPSYDVHRAQIRAILEAWTIPLDGQKAKAST